MSSVHLSAPSARRNLAIPLLVMGILLALLVTVGACGTLLLRRGAPRDQLSVAPTVIEAGGVVTVRGRNWSGGTGAHHDRGSVTIYILAEAGLTIDDDPAIEMATATTLDRRGDFVQTILFDNLEPGFYTVFVRSNDRTTDQALQVVTVK